LTERNRELIPETRGSILEGTPNPDREGGVDVGDRYSLG